jgi:acetyltransferase
MMEQTKVLTALKGVRGRKAVDTNALEALLVRFSELVTDHPRLREVDVNPLLASAEELLALDARMVLFGPDVSEEQLPHSAIRAYPIEYIFHWKMKDGSMVTIRPIRAEDEVPMVEFHKTLSDSTVYLRYFQMQKLETRVAHERLIRKCFLDYDREIALVAEREDKDSGRHELMGIGRLNRQRNPSEAELGIVIADRWQSNGLGTELVRRLIQIAKAEKIQRIEANILTENGGMVALAKHFQFRFSRDQDDPLSRIATLDLEAHRPSA